MEQHVHFGVGHGLEREAGVAGELGVGQQRGEFGDGVDGADDAQFAAGLLFFLPWGGALEHGDPFGLGGRVGRGGAVGGKKGRGEKHERKK